MRIIISIEYMDPWPGGNAITVGATVETYTEPSVFTYFSLQVPVADSDSNGQISDNVTATFLAAFEAETLIEIAPQDKVTVIGGIVR